MNLPSPAIVAQSAVRPLPRPALLLLCVAYVLAGWLGRDPWRGDDIAAFGYMLELAAGRTPWLAPELAGMAPTADGLLPLWLGAAAIRALGGWLPLELAARLPFIALLAATLASTWWAIAHLARCPGAQPVAFAFGGEAPPEDYARTLADAGLLALVACLGLAQLSHETSSYLTQLACGALVFLAAAVLPARPGWAAAAGACGLFGLVLSGAPTIAALLGAGGAWLAWQAQPAAPRERARGAALLAGLTLLAAGLAWLLDLWRWRIAAPEDLRTWHNLLRLLVWFTWPAWPLALWTLWRWRRQIASRQWHRHLWLPLWFTLVSLAATLLTAPADRALLVGLPALAALAAFALPTLKRGIAALIDWFTLLFFSIGAVAVWVVWLAVQTGTPARPAANVARLAPGFVPSFSLLAFGVALAATAGWAALVWWRAARNRAPLWKSLILPATGTTLGWLLLMTLWLPLLDYGRSMAPQAAAVTAALGPQPGCVAVAGLNRGQVTALMHHGALQVVPAARQAQAQCRWLVVDTRAGAHLTGGDPRERSWELVASVGRPTDRNDRLLVLRRATPAQH
ncbi:hypothetical protein [Melaminivora sp.]|uniref:hypothetical protein n=1 Tax=Melaminivora sp. TaxID=1933032 RepID=UPI0028A7CBE1|nr:hypothetical protein [Melaminivora sp.]